MASRRRGKRGRLVHPARPDYDLPALYVHDLTGTAEADRLLSSPAIIHPATPQIIPRVRQLDSKIGLKLSKKEDCPAKVPFRLITTDEFWLLGDVEYFVAVSYCWHSDEWEVPSRFGTPRKHTAPSIAPAVLRGLLSYMEESTAIWIDEVCIDQNNAREKAVAIGNMDVIYRNAEEVIVLLEDLKVSRAEELVLGLLAVDPPEEGYESQECLMVTEDSVRDNISTHCLPVHLDHLTVFIKNLLNCRWFTRAWCTQEYQLNESRSFLVVGRKYPCIVLEPIFAVACQEMEILSVDVGLIVTNSKLRFFSWGNGLRTPETITEGSIFQSFCEIASLKSSYLADIISVALNSNGIALTFAGSVWDRSECRFILALIALAAGDASVLGIEGLSMCRSNGADYGSVIRWPSTHEPEHTDFLGDVMPTTCSDLKISQISIESVDLDLYVLPSQLHQPTEASVRRAKRYYDASFGELHREQDYNEVGFQVNTLACALSCGIAAMMHASRKVIKSMAEYCESVLDGLRSNWITKAFQSASRHLLTAAELVAIDSLKVERTISEFLLVLSAGEKFFGDVTEFCSRIVQLDEASNRSAILLLPESLFKSRWQWNSYILAVPAALNGDGAVGVRRAWILDQTRFSRRSTSLKGRGFFFGIKTLDLHKDDLVSYSKSVRVYGPLENEQEFSDLDE